MRMLTFVTAKVKEGRLREGQRTERGTLSKAQTSRALAIFFIVSDVHPFNDGNGRIARAMMNSELIAKGETRVIIPSVFRSEFLAGVKRMTRESDPTAFIKQHKYLQDFVNSVDFTDIDKAVETLRGCNAFAKPEDAVRLQAPTRWTGTS